VSAVQSGIQTPNGCVSLLRSCGSSQRVRGTPGLAETMFQMTGTEETITIYGVHRLFYFAVLGSHFSALLVLKMPQTGS